MSLKVNTHFITAGQQPWLQPSSQALLRANNSMPLLQRSHSSPVSHAAKQIFLQINDLESDKENRQSTPNVQVSVGVPTQGFFKIRSISQNAIFKGEKEQSPSCQIEISGKLVLAKQFYPRKLNSANFIQLWRLTGLFNSTGENNQLINEKELLEYASSKLKEDPAFIENLTLLIEQIPIDERITIAQRLILTKNLSPLMLLILAKKLATLQKNVEGECIHLLQTIGLLSPTNLSLFVSILEKTKNNEEDLVQGFNSILRMCAGIPSVYPFTPDFLGTTVEKLEPKQVIDFFVVMTELLDNKMLATKEQILKVFTAFPLEREWIEVGQFISPFVKDVKKNRANENVTVKFIKHLAGIEATKRTLYTEYVASLLGELTSVGQKITLFEKIEKLATDEEKTDFCLAVESFVQDLSDFQEINTAWQILSEMPHAVRKECCELTMTFNAYLELEIEGLKLVELLRDLASSQERTRLCELARPYVQAIGKGFGCFLILDTLQVFLPEQREHSSVAKLLSLYVDLDELNPDELEPIEETVSSKNRQKLLKVSAEQRLSLLPTLISETLDGLQIRLTQELNRGVGYLDQWDALVNPPSLAFSTDLMEITKILKKVKKLKPTTQIPIENYRPSILNLQKMVDLFETNAEALHYVGNSYFKGINQYPQNTRFASAYLKKAAALNHAPSKICVGIFLLNKNQKVEARTILEEVYNHSRQGVDLEGKLSEELFCYLGSLYLENPQTAAEKEKGLELLKDAANRHNILAIHKLKSFYLNDKEQLLFWSEKYTTAQYTKQKVEYAPLGIEFLEVSTNFGMAKAAYQQRIESWKTAYKIQLKALAKKINANLSIAKLRHQFPEKGSCTGMVCNFMRQIQDSKESNPELRMRQVAANYRSNDGVDSHVLQVLYGTLYTQLCAPTTKIKKTKSNHSQIVALSPSTLILSRNYNTAALKKIYNSFGIDYISVIEPDLTNADYCDEMVLNELEKKEDGFYALLIRSSLNFNHTLLVFKSGKSLNWWDPSFGLSVAKEKFPAVFAALLKKNYPTITNHIYQIASISLTNIPTSS